ncbi:membrane metalloprotease [Cellulophaga sp. F20128]|uniref:membrane metalloprotease n=1 Tax=Cellulophaga sp. F20128 TaxID=2926413 RepID=UPI001FF2B86A|nr:membrane metalloprotease [Cellulophaga sp. F20128]MCK0157075.1 membrane metalloprotease [Cellulophaga sp. F20128]
MNNIKFTLIYLFSLLLSACSTTGTDTLSETEESFTAVDKTLNKQETGSAANDLLSDENYDKIVYELFYVKGFKPTEETITNFKTFITERLNKPKGSELILEEITVPYKETYTVSEIKAIEDNIRTKYNFGKEIAVFGLFLDGDYSGNTENGSVLGIAYRNTSFVVFENTVKRFSRQPLAPSTTTLTSTVLNHEFAHLLGLVNLGSPMQTTHQDKEHSKHCSVADCLMYWTAETGEGLLNSISGGTIPTLDAQCLADLKANGGK